MFASGVTIDLVRGVLLELCHADGAGALAQDARFVTVPLLTVGPVKNAFPGTAARCGTVDLTTVRTNKWCPANRTVNRIIKTNTGELAHPPADLGFGHARALAFVGTVFVTGVLGFRNGIGPVTKYRTSTQRNQSRRD